MSIKKSVLIVIFTLQCVGCSSSGTKIDEGAVSQLREGVTTEQQVLDRFGPPSSSTRLPDGSQMVSYSFVGVQTHPETFIPIVGAFVGGSDVEHSMVTMTFDQRGILKSYMDTRGGTGSGSNLEAISQTRKDTREVSP